MLKKWINRLLGDPEVTGLEYRFNHIVALLSVLVLIMASILNMGFHLGFWLTFLTLLGVPFMLFVYWISRFRKKYVTGKWLLTLGLFVLLDFLWFQNSGSAGPILYVFLIFYSLLIFVWDGTIRSVLMVAFFANLAILGWVDYHYADQIVRYASDQLRVLDVYTGLAMYALIATALLISVKEVFVREREKAQRSDRLKSAFLANMSHEIRTPMNSILGFSQLLEGEISPDERRNYIRIINDNSIYLLQLIEDIIDISKIEAEQIEVFPREFKLVELFEELKSIFLQALIKEEKTQISLDYTIEHENLVIRTDKTRLKQILTNLLTNAVKFTQQGRIEFGCRINGTWLDFYARDTGIGIAPEHHKEIFERFFKVEHTGPGRIYRGTGIGLAISRNLVELLGGKIWVNSEPGKGAEFCFRLPHLVPLESEHKEKTTETPLPGFNWRGKTILVAEDEISNFMFLKEVLKKTGVTILWARDGAEAVEQARQHPEIGLVLMDIKMPVLNGLDATRQIKSFRKELPVIAQTAYAMEGDEAKSREAGCNDYLSKPIRKDDLLKKVSDYLK